MTTTNSGIQVTRGNCPCLRTDPRELIDADGGVSCAQDRCEPEALWTQMPEQEAPLLPPAPDRAELKLSRLRGIYDGDLGHRLLLVTDPEVRRHVDLVTDIPEPVEEMTWRGPDSRAELVERLRRWRSVGARTSVLWIVDDEFEHLMEDDVEDVKLGAISYFSTGFSTTSLRRYLDILAGTDYRAELAVEGRLVELLENASRLVLHTPSLGTSCRFEHQQTEHWFSLHGPLQWGDQTVLPTGELSTLADGSGEYDAGSRLPLTGEVVFAGSPIIHRGDRGVSRYDTEQTYARLSPMEQVPVIARISGGWIEDFVAPTRASERLRDAFRGLVEAEPRYRKVHEFGFGTHRGCADRLRTNFHPNERWPGIHLGLGLGGHTPFHIDLALTEVDVLLESPDAGAVPLYPALGLRSH